MRVGHLAGQQQAEIFLPGEHRAGIRIGIGCDDDLGEDLRDGLGQRTVEGAVGGDDPAEGADRVAFACRAIGGDQVGAGGDTARVGMLDDGDRRRVELGHQFERRIRVAEIVVAELLALDLLGLGNAGPGRAADIKRGFLMGVFAISQDPGEAAGGDMGFGKLVPQFTREPGGDRAVIGCGPGVGLGREGAAQVGRERPLVGVEGRNHVVIVARIRDHGVVLGGRADHRRAADIDILDTVFVTGARGDGGLEGVEVDDDQVDRPDPVFGHCGLILGMVASGEDAAMDLGVQGLDPPVHDLGEAGMVGDLDDRNAGFREGLCGPARGQDFDAMAGEGLAEFGQS